jgi:hypothetical protein
MYISKLKTKLQNSINASKIDYNIEAFELYKQIMKQLSNTENKNPNTNPKVNKSDTTIYHMDSLYRDNLNDKYELSKLQQNPK